MAVAPDGGSIGAARLLPCGSHLCPTGIPSQCTYTPFWECSFRSGALLGSGSSSGCSIVYRGRGPEPSSLLSCYLGGFRLDDRALPLGRISKNASNPLLDVEVVNAVGVCYFSQLISDHPLSTCIQPCCCCCGTRLPTDPNPYGLYVNSKKAVASVAAANSRRATVIEEILPYEALQEEKGEANQIPVLVLPCGAAHSAIELVAIKHNLSDVVYSRALPRPSIRGASTGSVPGNIQRGLPVGFRQSKRTRLRSSSSSSRHSSSDSSVSDPDPESPHFSDWEALLLTAGCSLGLEGRCLAELHPQTFQWTRGEGQRLRREDSRCCERISNSSSSCCSFCCWCPMGSEVDAAGAARNIFARGEARHAPNPLDTIRPKESVVSERLLEVRTDDKHPFIKLIYARNSRGFYVARLRHSEEALDAAEAEAAVREAAAKKAILGSPDPSVVERFREGGVKRQLEVQVLHDAPYGYRVPRQQGGLTRHKDRESGVLRFNVPKQQPAHPTVINIAVSPTDVGEAALLYSSQFVSLWKAEEARMEVEVPVSLAAVTRNIRRTTRPSMRYRQRAAAADPAFDSFQTLCYWPHRRQTLFLGSDNLWALDLRAKGITRLFPALHAPTHGSTLQCVAEEFYAPCTANSSYHTAFTALAPHPTQPFLLAAAHDATESVFLFDARAMHEPLTVVGLPTIRKTGGRYRSLLWHSCTDQWAEAHKLEEMRATSFSGWKAHKAAVATAGTPEGGISSTHDFLAAFSWRSEDVVCSAFRVHPAFCPYDTSRPSHASGQQSDLEDPLMGRSWASSAAKKLKEPQGRLQQRPRFKSSPLKTVQAGCLPTVISREVVEMSWQAEVSLFPRVSWGLENRERCYPIPSRTPVGSSWTQKPPLHVTVDEHTATSTFHGFAGACFFNLPITSKLRNILLYEGRQPPASRLHCRSCKNCSQHFPSTQEPFLPDIFFCEKCCSPISGFGGRPHETMGSLAVLGALTTSGRLTCRPLILNDPVLQLRLQRRRRHYATLARLQRRFRKGHNAGAADVTSRPAGNLKAGELPETLAALFSFHACQLPYRGDASSPSLTGKGAPPEASAGCEAIAHLLGQLQGSPNELRVLPQRIPLLFLHAQLQQSLQKELLFHAALRWKRGQQLRLLRLAQLEGHFGPCKETQALATEMVCLLRSSLAAMKLSVQWPRKLASFDFCDSGALEVHQPAFLMEAYDPEPIVQMLLADPHHDAHLDSRVLPHTEVASAVGPHTTYEFQTTDVGRATGAPVAASSVVTPNSASIQTRPTEGDASPTGNAIPGNGSTCVSSLSTSSNCLDGREEEQGESFARAAEEFLESDPREYKFTAVAEVSALPFPTTRSRAVFRFAIEAVEALSHVTTENSLLQLRFEKSALLNDLLVAVRLWRDRVLTDSQTIRLLRPFTLCRPCSPGLLDMQRTTLPLGIPLPRSPQDALEAALGKTQLLSCTHSALIETWSSTPAATSEGRTDASNSQGFLADEVSDGLSAATRDTTQGKFRKVANPAVAPFLLCCCRVLLQHHCDVHSCAVATGAGHWRKAVEGEYPVTQYSQTDGVQALLEVLKTESDKWLKGPAANRTGACLTSACFLPQAIVDELSEALFLTHEVLLVPWNGRNGDAARDISTAVMQQIIAGNHVDAAALTATCTLGTPGKRHGHLRGMDANVSKSQKPPTDRDTCIAKRGALSGMECPLVSPWLPACCLSRHLYLFIRTDRLLADEKQLQEALQPQAWPELLLQMQSRKTVETTRDIHVHDFSRYPDSPHLELPQSMQSHLPDHVLEGLERCKWKRLLSGIAVNDVIIADLIKHWDVSAVQQLREARNDQHDMPVRSQVEGQAGGSHRDTLAEQGLVDESSGSVAKEVERLLFLLPRTSEGIPVFASVQAQQQKQRRIQAERQHLLDTIALAMRQET